jgi:hypothetical protein
MKPFELIFIVAMLLPFAIQADWTYYYWIAIALIYLAYIAVTRWEYE